MYIKVRVQAGAREESFSLKKKDYFEIKVRQKAERNMANKQVMTLIAQHYNIPLGKVKIISGHHSPSKILSVDI